MDMFNPAWLHPQSNIDSSQHNPLGHDGRLQNDSWKDRATTATANETGETNPANQSSLELHDFGLGDITAAGSTSTTPSPFYSHTYQNNFYISPSSPAAFNAASFNPSPWAASNSQLPLSNYSSLNGATIPHHHLHQNQSQPMMIDPSLTAMSSSASNDMSPYPALNYSAPSLQQQPQRQSSFQHQPQLHSSSLSINPSFVDMSFPQHQGTLSPHALHTPSAMPPSAFSSASALPSPITEADRREFEASLKPMLLASAFSGASAVHSLVSLVSDFGSQEVDAATRLEILTKMRDKAGNYYFRAWAENTRAIDITREWLKTSFTANPDSPLAETTMPLLHVIDRLPLTVDSLKASKLGKIVVKLVKDPPTPAIKDMASNIERKWRQMVNSGGTKPDTSTEDPKTKKRKLSEAPASRTIPPSKKAATNAPASKLALKETKVTAVKDAKSDSSFFSAPKPKPKLPSFKKAPPVKKEPEQNVAQPSNIDPFKEALKSMAKTKRDSPAVSTPPPTAPGTQSKSTIGLSKNGKKRKSVTWAPEGQLEAVRLIEKAIYDDDPVDGIHTAHNLRDLDRGEGAALHSHIFEEVIDWTEPILIEIPGDIEVRPRGGESVEKTTQEEREQAALGALYMSPAHIPDSPGEAMVTTSDEELDKDVQVMTCGPDVEPIFWGSDAMELMQPSVADLVGQLAPGSAIPPNGQADPGGSKPLGLDASDIQSLPPEQLQQLLAQLTQHSGYQQTNTQQGYGGEPENAWGHSYEEYSAQQQGYSENFGGRQYPTEGRGRGRGRGGGYKGNKRKPCSYFAAGRCRFGDQCDFSHEPGYS